VTGYVMLLLASYLLGSVPFGYLAVKTVAGVDVRTVGSGNIGATNVRRTAGNVVGVVVLALDIAKGFVPAYFFPLWFGGFWGGASPVSVAVVCGLGAILGHVFTVFMRFRGGKGVATGCGVAFGLAPLPAAVALGAFVVVVAVWRYISLGSMTAAVVFLVALVLLGKEPWGRDLPVTLFAAAMAALVIVRHRGNVQRLLAGTEHKLGQDRRQPAQPSAQEPADPSAS